MVLALGDISNEFSKKCMDDPDQSEAIIAIDLLQKVVNESNVSTIQGLHDVLNNAIAEMSDTGLNYLCVKSACELFQRFITLTVAEYPDDFNQCKKFLQDRAKLFLKKVSSCKQQIAHNFVGLLPQGTCLLVHSYSRVVLTALTQLSQALGPKGTRLHCYVTCCAPQETGRLMTKQLAKKHIPCTLIPDLAIAYVMPKVTLVLMGAQAVVESGGILNDFGSATVAMIAFTSGKPVYVLAESFKFIRAFPLDQQHVPEMFKLSLTAEDGLSKLPHHTTLDRSKFTATAWKDANSEDDDNDEKDDFPEMHSAWARVQNARASLIERIMPSVDYTSPRYISYLVTDLGVLTPSVVSDELIKLYL